MRRGSVSQTNLTECRRPQPAHYLGQRRGTPLERKARRSGPMCPVKDPQGISLEVKLHRMIGAVVTTPPVGFPNAGIRPDLPLRSSPETTKGLLNKSRLVLSSGQNELVSTAPHRRWQRQKWLGCLAGSQNYRVRDKRFSISGFLRLSEVSLGILNGFPHFIGRNLKGSR